MKIDSVTQSVIKHLREKIITGELQPGAKLNEIEMAEGMEVSRPPLREAFRKLEYEKLVVSIPRKGTYVSHISLQDCTQLFFVRKTIEFAAIDCLKEHKADQLTLLEESLDITDHHPDVYHVRSDTQQMLQYYDIIAKFHYKLIESSENRWLTHCYNSLRPNLARYQIIYLHLPGSGNAATEDHRDVLRMIKLGKFEDGKELLGAHIDKTLARVVQRMK